MAINMWPWYESLYTLINSNSQHLSKSFYLTLALSRKVHWAITCAILLSSSPPFLQKAFQDTYSWWLFSRKGLLGCKQWTQGTNVPWVHWKKHDLLLGWSLDTKGQHLLGSLQEMGITSWLLSLDTRYQRSLGFIARSGNNFLVVITKYKGGKSFVVHCL